MKTNTKIILSLITFFLFAMFGASSNDRDETVTLQFVFAVTGVVIGIFVIDLIVRHIKGK